METSHKIAAVVAVGALALIALEWLWLDWRWGRQVAELREEIAFLRGDVAALQNRRWQGEHPAEPELTEERLQRALTKLDSKNVLDRYQAGLTVKEYGKHALPGLLETVRRGSSRAGGSALAVIADLECPEALPELREIVGAYLAGTGPASGEADAGPLPDRKTATAILGILARMEDEEASALFQQGLDDPEESVRAACIVGLRRLGGVEFVPALLGRLGKEQRLVHQELEKTICSLSRRAPDRLVDLLGDMPPKTRFTLAAVLGRDRSSATMKVLRALTGDADPRVALAAAKFLGKRGDQSGRAVAERLATEAPTGELQGLAEGILKEFEERVGGGE